VELTTNQAKNDSPPKAYPKVRSLSIRQWRNDVYEELNEAGMEKVAERWLSCELNHFTKLKPSEAGNLPASAKSIYVCSENHHHEAEVYSQTCDLRICPECARRHSARLVARYLPKMLELMHLHHRSYQFRQIIFTTPYPLTDPDIRKKMLKGFKQVDSVMRKLMTRGKWRSEQAYLTGCEFGTDGLKLHYHVIHYGQYMPQGDLVNAWRLATNGDASIVFVKGFPYVGMSMEESLREVLKYCTKFYSQNKETGENVYLPPALMPVLARTLEKTRRVRSAGLFYNLPKPDRTDHLCQTCNAPMVSIPVDYYVTYCNTGFLPVEWRDAKAGTLLLKPADKSSSETSGIPPPGSQGISISQKMMDFIKNVRNKWQD